MPYIVTLMDFRKKYIYFFRNFLWDRNTLSVLYNIGIVKYGYCFLPFKIDKKMVPLYNIVKHIVLWRD